MNTDIKEAYIFFMKNYSKIVIANYQNKKEKLERKVKYKNDEGKFIIETSPDCFIGFLTPLTKPAIPKMFINTFGNVEKDILKGKLFLTFIFIYFILLRKYNLDDTDNLNYDLYHSEYFKSDSRFIEYHHINNGFYIIINLSNGIYIKCNKKANKIIKEILKYLNIKYNLKQDINNFYIYNLI